MGRGEEVLKIYADFENHYHSDKPFILSYGITLQKLGQWEKAKEKLSTLEKKYPNDKSILLSQCILLEAMGKSFESTKKFNELVKRFPQNKVVLHALSRHLLNTGKFHDALDKVDFSLKLFPGDKEFILQKVQALLKMGKAKEGRELIDKLLKHYPYFISAHRLKASFSGMFRSTREKEVTLNQLIERFPYENSFRILLAKFLMQESRDIEAENTLHSLLSINAYCIEGYRQLARCYYYQNQVEKVEKILFQMTKLFPHNAPLLLDAAWFFLFLKDEKLARDFAKNYISIGASPKAIKDIESIFESFSLYYMDSRSSISKNNVKVSNKRIVSGKVEIDDNIKKVMFALIKKGHEVQLFGESVVAIMHRLHKADVFLSTSATNKELQEIFPTAIPSPYIPGRLQIESDEQRVKILTSESSQAPVPWENLRADISGTVSGDMSFLK